MTIVHTAGTPRDGEQTCERRGALLTPSTISVGFWPEHERVAFTTKYAYPVRPGRDLEDGEQQCKAKP